MHTVFRVKRRLDEKQLTGLLIAKRQRLEGDVPVILTFAGTTPENDSRTALSVMKSHQKKHNLDSSNQVTFKEINDELSPAENQTEATRSSLLTDSDVDDLFKIYDAYQNNISNPGVATKVSKQEESDWKGAHDSKFVYDIYYVRQRSSPGTKSTTMDFDERNFMLKLWNAEDEELVHERGEDIDSAEGFEDEDSNAEDNPNNDYPDEEEWYYNDGGEIPLEDDEYYHNGRFDPLSPLENKLQDLNFYGSEDCD